MENKIYRQSRHTRGSLEGSSMDIMISKLDAGSAEQRPEFEPPLTKKLSPDLENISNWVDALDNRENSNNG